MEQAHWSDAMLIQYRLVNDQEVKELPSSGYLAGRPPLYEWTSLDDIGKLKKADPISMGTMKAAYWAMVANLLHHLGKGDRISQGGQRTRDAKELRALGQRASYNTDDSEVGVQWCA